MTSSLTVFLLLYDVKKKKKKKKSHVAVGLFCDRLQKTLTEM